MRFESASLVSSYLSSISSLISFPLYHDALLRMQGHKIRMPAERPDRDVVPHLGVVFEAILQAFGETQLAACIESRSADGGNQGGHGMGLGAMCGRERQKVPGATFFPITWTTSKTF
jgi:hypothetical protein